MLYHIHYMLIFISQITGTQLKELETKLKEKVKLEAEINAVDKASKDNISSEERNLKQLEKVISIFCHNIFVNYKQLTNANLLFQNFKIDENALIVKEQQLTKIKNLYETLKNTEASDAEALAACQKKYEAICAGMEVNEAGEAQTLMSQLMSK